MQHAVSKISMAVTLFALLFLGACAGTSDYMRNLEPAEANYQPKPDKALIVFMRP